VATGTACLKTHQRWECQLATIGIFADPFTDRFFRPFGVEEVVSDLEGEPKGFAISLQGPCLLGRRTGCQTTEPEACEKQSACLAAVNAFEPGKVCGGGVGLCGTVLGGLFRGKVFRLAADKSLCPCCCRQNPTGMSCLVRREETDERLKSERLQGVSAENRGGLIKRAVAGWAAPSQVVVVHCRQVVMYQGIRVDHFHGHRAGGSLLAASSAGLGSPDGQGWPQAFAWSEKCVADGLAKPFRGSREPVDSLFEQRIDECPDFCNRGLNVKRRLRCGCGSRQI
jgi:hypothetical protein